MGTSYEDTARALWQTQKPLQGELPLLQRELVRYACLAPSSHNTQCLCRPPGGVRRAAVGRLEDALALLSGMRGRRSSQADLEGG